MGTIFLFFKPPDLENGRFVIKSQEYLSKKGLEVARLLPKDSILVTCIGATIGKTGIIRVEGTSNQQINAIVPFKNFIFPQYVYYQVITPFFQKQIKTNATATTLPILNKTKFEKLSFILTSLLEQQKIVEEIEYRLSIADKLEETVDKLLKLAEKLKQSYLKYAFKGKLTEEWRKQNSHLITGENSVDKLLEKIKAEKEKFEKQKKEGKKIQRKKKMKEKPKNLSILEVLEENGGEMDSKEVWKASKYSDNIEKFYEELKELYLNKKIEEQKTERGSILRLKR